MVKTQSVKPAPFLATVVAASPLACFVVEPVRNAARMVKRSLTAARVRGGTHTKTIVLVGD